MSSDTIDFHFDYISSNAYLAWTQLPELAAKYGARIEPRPVLFAGLLEAHGQLGPAEVPAKSAWMAKDNARKAIRLSVPLNPPAFHPFNPLLALRASSLPLEAEKRIALIDALFRAVWVRGLHVSEPSVVERVANEIGLPGTSIVAQAGSAESKLRLRSQTDEAIAHGVFGVPTMIVGDELFWGFDDFAHLELVLAGADPLDPAQWGQWSARRPAASAARRRFRPDTERA